MGLKEETGARREKIGNNPLFSPGFRPLVNGFLYSYRRLSTGLARAALTDW